MRLSTRSAGKETLPRVEVLKLEEQFADAGHGDTTPQTDCSERGDSNQRVAGLVAGSLYAGFCAVRLA